jgi:hypothetical protein
MIPTGNHQDALDMALFRKGGDGLPILPGVMRRKEVNCIPLPRNTNASWRRPSPASWDS